MIPRLVAAALVFSPLALRAQQAVPTATVLPAAPVFSDTLGRATAQNGEVSLTYAVSATQPPASKLTGQKILLRIDGTRPAGTSAQTLLIDTGKYKTVGAMAAFLAANFQRFLAGPVALGQDFDKIGTLALGGEIHFVAASADQLDYRIMLPGKPDAGGHFDRAAVQAFTGILTGKPAR